jgi:hypothetical protein
MTIFTSFAAGLAAVAVLALLAVAAMRRSLGELLVELCGNERRARFWSVFTALTLILFSIEGALLVLPSRSSQAWQELPGLYDLLASLRAGVFGFLCALGGLGFVLLIGVLRYRPETGAPSESGRAPRVPQWPDPARP